MVAEREREREKIRWSGRVSDRDLCVMRERERNLSGLRERVLAVK